MRREPCQPESNIQSIFRVRLSTIYFQCRDKPNNYCPNEDEINRHSASEYARFSQIR